MCCLAAVGHADIYRFSDGSTIPGTEGVVPGPGLILNNLNLDQAHLSGEVLTNSEFRNSSLIGALLVGADLRQVNFSAANLSFAALHDSSLAGAILTDARIRFANFDNTTAGGFTKEQLYSTADFQSRDLQRLRLGGNVLTGWSFKDQNLAGVDFAMQHNPQAVSILNSVDFTGAGVVRRSHVGPC
jgi:uncharacterized protein YjbI with pentapeptide repeats